MLDRTGPRQRPVVLDRTGSARETGEKNSGGQVLVDIDAAVSAVKPAGGAGSGLRVWEASRCRRRACWTGSEEIVDRYVLDKVAFFPTVLNTMW